jgi:hypothetical protein
MSNPDYENGYQEGLRVGMAQSRNYIASDAEMPEWVRFANGVTVRIVDNKSPGVHNGVYLEVEKP